MPVDLRQISFYPAQRQYVLNDSEPGLEIVQSGSGNYLVARPSGGGSPVFQITNAIKRSLDQTAPEQHSEIKDYGIYF